MKSLFSFIGRSWITGTVAIIVTCLLSACSTDVASMIKAAAADPSTSCLHVNLVVTGAMTQDITWARGNSQAGSQATGGPNGCTINHQDVPTAAPQPAATPQAPSAPTAVAPVTAAPTAWKPVLPVIHAVPAFYSAPN